jgi:hypothetical protein
MGSKKGGNSGGGGSYPPYRTDREAEKRQREAHEAEMKRLEEAHQQQMKLMYENQSKFIDVLVKLATPGNIAEQRYEKDKASIESTQEIHRKLEKKRGEYKATASMLEANIRDTAKTGFDMILAEVENIKNTSGISIDTAVIRQKSNNFIGNIDGSISEVLNRRVALSDPECAGILELETEDEREQKLSAFLKAVVKESLRRSESQLEEVMTEALDLVASIVTNRINDKKQELQSAANELTSMENALSESELKQKDERYKSAIGEITDFLNKAAGIVVAAA